MTQAHGLCWRRTGIAQVRRREGRFATLRSAATKSMPRSLVDTALPMIEARVALDDRGR